MNPNLELYICFFISFIQIKSVRLTITNRSHGGHQPVLSSECRTSKSSADGAPKFYFNDSIPDTGQVKLSSPLCMHWQSTKHLSCSICLCQNCFLWMCIIYLALLTLCVSCTLVCVCVC
eukprot:c23553_g3_i1 orf=1-354(-)